MFPLILVWMKKSLIIQKEQRNVAGSNLSHYENEKLSKLGRYLPTCKIIPFYLYWPRNYTSPLTTNEEPQGRTLFVWHIISIRIQMFKWVARKKMISSKEQYVDIRYTRISLNNYCRYRLDKICPCHDILITMFMSFTLTTV